MRISDWSSDVCSSDLAAIERFDIGDAPALNFPLIDIPLVGDLVAGGRIGQQTQRRDPSRLAAGAGIMYGKPLGKMAGHRWMYRERSGVDPGAGDPTREIGRAHV